MQDYAFYMTNTDPTHEACWIRAKLLVIGGFIRPQPCPIVV